MTASIGGKRTSQGEALPAEVVVKPAYSPESLAEAFSIGRTLVFEELRTGRLRSMRIGRRRLIAGADALAWLESYRAASAPPPPRDRRSA